MTRQIIHSKYHKALEAEFGVPVQYPDLDFDDYVDTRTAGLLLNSLESSPRFVIQDDLIQHLAGPSGDMMVKLRKLGGIEHRLPHHLVVVEFDGYTGLDFPQEEPLAEDTKVRHFISLQERPGHKEFIAMGWHYAARPGGVAYTMLAPWMFVMEVSPLGLAYTPCKAMWIRKDVPMTAEARELFVGPVAIAVASMMILLHTKGIERETITVDAKLNKARAKSGKRPIRDHVLVKVGHVYDRHGNRVPYTSGRHMPLHWRAGHFRDQRYGTNLTKVKRIFIEAMLVNYVDDGGPKPRPKIKELTT